MKISKLQKLGIAFGIGLAFATHSSSQAATVSYSTDFAPFLPSTFNAGDSYNLSFKIYDQNRTKPIPIIRIKYTIIIIINGQILSIPFYFEFLSPQSYSRFTSPSTATANGVDLTLAGLGGFAITNGFSIPSKFGFTRADIKSANLSFNLETNDFAKGDGFVASLNLNGKSLGSQTWMNLNGQGIGTRGSEPMPEPSTILGLLLLGGAMGILKKKDVLVNSL